MDENAEKEVKEKKEYELAVLVKSEDDLASVVALVRANNGEISAEPQAKKLALAYEIKKDKEAIFAYLRFRALPEDCKNLEKALRTAGQVIRSLIVVPFPPNAVSTGERPSMAAGAGVGTGSSVRRSSTRTMRSGSGSGSGFGSGSGSSGAPDIKPSAPSVPLSNEALEKKIEEILG